MHSLLCTDEFNTPKNHEFYVTLSDDPLALEEVEEVSTNKTLGCILTHVSAAIIMLLYLLFIIAGRC